MPNRPLPKFRFAAGPLGRLAALALVAALPLSACDRNGNPLAATLPASVVSVAGNGQTAPVSSAVPVAPRVRVLTVSGSPLAGVTVTWDATVGDGQVSPSTSTTDAQGEASTQWTFDGTPGPQQITATVEGLDPVVFSGTATSG